MNEPVELTAAREHLGKAEALLESQDGLYHLHEGLALLEAILHDTDSRGHHTVARNLGATYAARLYERIERRVRSSRSLPEPQLEHLFAVVLCFDAVSFELPAPARALKIELVRRLIDLYYEGHSPAEKEQLLAELARLDRGDLDSD